MFRHLAFVFTYEMRDFINETLYKIQNGGSLSSLKDP